MMMMVSEVMNAFSDTEHHHIACDNEVDQNVVHNLEENDGPENDGSQAHIAGSNIPTTPGFLSTFSSSIPSQSQPPSSLSPSRLPSPQISPRLSPTQARSTTLFRSYTCPKSRASKPLTSTTAEESGLKSGYESIEKRFTDFSLELSPRPVPQLLSTINEKCFKDSNENDENVPNSNEHHKLGDDLVTLIPRSSEKINSFSIPEFTGHKFPTPKSLASNLWMRSKRKSIAVSSMLRDSDRSNDNNNNNNNGDGFKNNLQKPTITKTKISAEGSYDSSASSVTSTTTTTSESYHLKDLPTNLPARLATLSKPPIHTTVLQTPFGSNRRARHSIDVRLLPSYLAKKRHSTFGQLLSVLAPTAPDESSSSDDPLFAEPIAPTLSLGERIAWIQSSGPEFGLVKWIGRMPQISLDDWTVGIEFDNAIGSGDGTVDGRRYFVAKENFAKFLPISELTKVDNYAGRPRSGTMLSRMSVQLKPGQLISIQRSPTTTVQHCYLNAPHHVGHDVHHPNNRHCQCHSCNHPCAHICKTRKPKGKRWTEDMAHMCHFSSKPHATMCCGGEDLPAAMQPLKEPGTSWKHSEVISSFQTVPAEILHQRKATLQSFSFNPTRSASIAKDFSLKKHQIGDRFNRDSIKDSSNENGSNNNINRDNNKNEKSSCNNLHDAEIVPQQRSTTPRPPSSLETSCFLERTGSDLSISSLPSSSSVAEIYINRSVLTDESDIDSETERSLDSNRQQRQNTKQGFRSLVACFLANSLRLKSIKFDSQNQSDLSTNRSRKLHHPTTKINHHRHHSNASARKKVIRTKRKPQRLGLSSTDTSYHLDVAPQNNPSTSKNLKKNNIENENRSHSGSSATPQPCFTSATDQFIQSIKMNPAHNHTSNQVYSSPRIDQMQKYQSMKMNLSNQKLSPYACTPLNSNLDHNRSQPNFATNMPPLPPIPVSSQQSLLSHRSHPIDGHISEEPLTSTSSSTTQKYTIAESSDMNNSTSHNEKSISSQAKQALNYSTTTSGENSQSPRRRRQKGPAPKPPSKDRDDPVDYSSRRMTNVQPISTTSPTASSFNQSLSNSSLTTNCSVNVDKKIFQNLVLDDGGVRGFGDGLDGADDDDNEGGGNNDGDNPQSLQQQSPNQLPPNLVRSLSEQKQLNMKLMINAVPTFRSEVNLQKISDAKIVTKTDTIAGGDDVDVDDLKVNNNEKKSRNAMHNNLDADDDDVILINNLNNGDIGKNIKKSKHNNGDQPKHHHHRNHQHHHHHHHHRRHHHHHNQDNQKNDTILLKHKDEKIDENIYEIPISGRNLLKIKQNDDDYPPPPLLPKKTFDPLKVFGCSIDTDTNKLLERKEQESNDQNRVCQRTKRELSLSKMAPSDLIPLEQYTCCALHWQEYLDQISSTIVEPIMVVGDVGPTIVCDDNLEDDSQHEISKNIAAKSEYSKIQNEKIDGVGDCYQCKTCGTMMDKKIMNNEPNESDALMIDALLSPKHDHVRWKRNSLIQLVNNDENKGGGSLTKSISPSTDDFNHIDSLFEEMINCELVRTCSDGSLTNTASLATVVEQQSDTLPNHSNLIRFQDLCRNSNLKDVFCQTNFNDSSSSSTMIGTEKLPRRSKHCRCRANFRYRNSGHNVHSRHSSEQSSHQSSHHHHHRLAVQNDCYRTTNSLKSNNLNSTIGLAMAEPKFSLICSTSSTSDHSVSSLSSSNSTLSETATVQRRSNNIQNLNIINNSGNDNNELLNDVACNISDVSCVRTNEISFSNRMKPFSNETEPKMDENGPQSIECRNNLRENNLHRANFEVEEFSSGLSPTSYEYSSAMMWRKNLQKENVRLFEEIATTFGLNDTVENKNQKPINYDRNIATLPNSKGNWSRFLMSQLELAIANGDHQRAAHLAKELAIKSKANCSMMTNSLSMTETTSNFCVDTPIVAYLYIDHQTVNKDPIPYQLFPTMTVHSLRLKIEKEFQIPFEMQRLVLGKYPATDLDATLFSYGITNSGCPIFLHIIKPSLSSNVDIDHGVNNDIDLRCTKIASSDKISSLDMNPNEIVTSKTLTTLLDDREDDNVFELLQPMSMTTSTIKLSPYLQSISSETKSIETGENRNCTEIDCTKSDGKENAVFINYIQNPLATINFQDLSLEHHNVDNKVDSESASESIGSFLQKTEILSFPKNDILFESLNYVNELLPSVKEENEDELERYDNDQDDERDISNTNPQSLNFRAIDKNIVAENLHEADGTKIGTDSIRKCSICSSMIDTKPNVELIGSNECVHRFCRNCIIRMIPDDSQQPMTIKCPQCYHRTINDEDIESMQNDRIKNNNPNEDVTLVNII